MNRRAAFTPLTVNAANGVAPRFEMSRVDRHGCFAPNPNGIPSVSPGLPSRRGYPGARSVIVINPERVASCRARFDHAAAFAFLRQRRQAARMSLVLPSADKLAQLEQRMAALNVRESDIQETFVRSGGKGGQKVNKSSSCVMLLHVPTGLRVKCQATRQQGMNRFLARRLLLDKIEEKQQGFVAAKRAEVEKIRRQKRKRSRRARERVLADKARRSEKKDRRARISVD
jgi:peptide chain release factor